MDNGYCLYIEALSSVRLMDVGLPASYIIVPGNREDEHLPTSEQATRHFVLESNWSQGEHYKNNTWTTWLGGPEFGHTSRPDPSNNLYYSRQIPVQESLIRRGLIARPQPLKDMEREVCKFNISLNPERYTPRTKAWKMDDHRQNPTDEELVALRLAHFPNVPGLVTKAPMVLSGNEFKYPANSEHSAIEKIMAIPELREKILEHHLGQWQGLSNLARTSQTMFNAIGNTFSHWDLTNGWFGGCDLTMALYEAKKDRGVWTMQQRKQAKAVLKAMHERKKGMKPKHIDSTKYVSVHPVRDRQTFGEKTLSGQMVPGTEWYDHSDAYPDPLNEDPVVKGENHISLLRGICREGENIRCLHLHRVPYLNVNAVKAIVNSMPNLRVLGIYSCDLLNFSHTKELLNIVIDANRVNSARPPIDFDYYPRFYRGPVEDRVGSYGVVWNDEGDIKTTLAVAAALLSILRTARDGNIDLASSRDKSFLKWLNDFPWEFCTLPIILASIARILGFEGKYKEMLTESYKERYGFSYRDGMVDFETDTETLERTLHMDLYIAVMGEPQGQKFMDTMDFFDCAQCGEKLLAAFFKAEQAKRSPGNRVCHGCELWDHLHDEIHDFKKYKRTIAAVPWVRGNMYVDKLKVLFREENKEYSTGIAPKWAWKKRLLGICEQLRDEIPNATRASLEMSLKRRDDLNNHRETFTNGYEHFYQRPIMAEVQAEVDRHKTILGEQIPVIAGNEMANDWDEMRRKYCCKLEIQTGRFQNLGPHMGLGWQKWM